MLEFCSFHPGEPEYPNIQFKNSTLPMGEYPCCGELALRFQPLFQVWLYDCFLLLSKFPFKASNGCKVRDHKLRVRTPTESELYRTLMTHRDLICVRCAYRFVELSSSSPGLQFHSKSFQSFRIQTRPPDTGAVVIVFTVNFIQCKVKKKQNLEF